MADGANAAVQAAAEKYASTVMELRTNTHAMAAEAFKTALVANTMIEQHEKICGQRWRVVITTNFMLISTALSILGVLLADKFF